MHQLLLRGGSINFRFVLGLFLGPFVLSIAKGLNYYSYHLKSETEVTFPFAYMSTAALFPFATFCLWAFALQRINNQKILNRIFIPAILIATLESLRDLVNHIISGSVSDYTWFFYVTPFIAFFALVGVCELLYEKFENKLALYALAVLAESIVYEFTLPFIFSDRSLPISYSLTFMVGDIIGVFLTAFFLTLLGQEYILPNSVKAARRKELRDKISTGLNSLVPRQDLFNSLRMEFSEVKDKFIARSIAKSIDNEDKRRNRGANAFLLILLLLSATYNLYSYTSKGLPFGPFQWNWYYMERFLPPLFMAAVVLIKLKLSVDLLNYKPYVYSVLIVFSGLALAFGIYQFTRSGFSIEWLITIAGNLCVIYVASFLSRHLFPNYRLLYTLKGNEGYVV